MCPFSLLVGNLSSQAFPSLLPGGGKTGNGTGESGMEGGRPQGSTSDLLQSGLPMAVPTTFRLILSIF